MLTRLLLLFTLILALGNSVNAQWVNTSSVSGAPIEEIYFPAPDTGFYVTAAFGSGGKIFGTTDGQNFSQLYADANNYFLSAFFLNSEIGWVGGGGIGSGIILFTDDGGASWDVQTTSCEQIESIFFVSEAIGWAVANDATSGTYFIYHTIDGGQNWDVQKTGFDYVRSVYFTSPTVGYVAGDNGRIFKTNDGGVNWYLLNTNVVFHFNDIQFISPLRGWASGYYSDGGMYETNDSGATWHRILTTAGMNYWGLAFVTPSYGFIAGDNGTIRVTTNGGASWNSMTTGHSETVTSFSFPDSSQGFASSNYGRVQRLGGTFTNISSASSSTSFSIYPNPMNDYSMLVLNTAGATITITDMSGRIVSEANVSDDSFLIDGTEWAKGVYLVTVRNGEGVYTSRLVK